MAIKGRTKRTNPRPSNNPAQYEPEPKGGEEAGKFWRNRFDRALAFRQNSKYGDKAWKQNLKMYLGDHWSVQLEGQDTLTSDNPNDFITVNITASSCLNMLPFLIRRRPSFKVNARQAQYDVSSDIQEDVLNYSWKEFDMQPQARKTALDGIIFGHAIMKDGFTIELDESKRTPVNGRIEYRDYVKKAAPFIRRVSPFNFVYDPDAAEFNLDSARWCAEIFWKPIQDLVENKAYRASAVAKIKNGEVTLTTRASFMKMSDSDDSLIEKLYENEDNHGDMKLVLCFELWDKRSGKYYVFAHGCDDPLKEESEWPYDYLEAFPYTRYEFIPVPEHHFPMSLVAFIKDQQFELNRLRTSMFQHRRRFNRKYKMVENEVESDQVELLKTGGDGTIIVVKNADSITPLEDASISRDEYNIEGVIKEDIRELIGSDELTRGGQLPSRTTATEVQARTKLYGLKLEDRVEQFDRFIEKIGRKILQHIKGNWIASDVVRITGPVGHFWRQWTQEQIQGEYDFELEPTSTEIVDKTTERQQAIQILGMFIQGAPLLAQSGVQVVWGELYKWVLSHFEQKDMQRFFPLMGQVKQPIQQGQGMPMQNGMAAPPGGAFTPGANMPQNPNAGLPPNPQNQQAQPAAGNPGQVFSGLMGAVGGTM